jgi:hypothetical protein
VKVEQRGKNLLRLDNIPGTSFSGITRTWDEGYWHLKGTATTNVATTYIVGTSSISMNIYFKADATYCLSVETNYAYPNQIKFDIEYEDGTTAQVNSGTFTPQKDGKITHIRCVNAAGGINFAAGTPTDYYFGVQLELGTTATAYEPYQGQSHSISFPSTVYGGKANITEGKVLPYPYYAEYNGEPLSGEWMCDRAKYEQGTTPPIGSQVVDLGTFGTELNTTPTEIKTLKGNNTLWGDGDIEVEYCCDTKLYIDKKINALI